MKFLYVLLLRIYVTRYMLACSVGCGVDGGELMFAINGSTSFQLILGIELWLQILRGNHSVFLSQFSTTFLKLFDGV